MMKKINRRDFIAKSSVGFAGVSAGLVNLKGFNNEKSSLIPEEAKIKEYRTLGRTGFRISDIGCGPATIANENVLKAVLETGVNFIDTAEFYGNGNNELLIGRAIKGLSRNSIFINTKISVTDEDTSEGIVIRVRKCLERLDTDYLDGLMLWNPVSIRRIKDKAFHRAFEQLKNEGRVHYCGVSNHGTNWNEQPEESMDNIIGSAVEDGRFDFVLFVYNYVQKEMGESILKACASRNIGTTLMKTDPFGGAYLNVLEMAENLKNQNREIPEGFQGVYKKIIDKQKLAESYLTENQLQDISARREAAISFALNNQSVNSVLISFRNFEDIDNYIKLSGKRLTADNISLIESLKLKYGHLYCRHACGLCESSCPDKVPVNTIMRYNHYFMAQSREKYALIKYNQLPGKKAESCAYCQGFCEQHCPFGVPVKALLTIAHDNLTIA